MYGWIWAHLPGPLVVRLFLVLVLLTGVVVVFFTWLFPAIAPMMPFNDGTVDQPTP